MSSEPPSVRWNSLEGKITGTSGTSGVGSGTGVGPGPLEGKTKRTAESRNVTV